MTDQEPNQPQEPTPEIGPTPEPAPRKRKRRTRADVRAGAERKAELRANVLKLWAEGRSKRSIAKELNTTYHRVARCLDSRVREVAGVDRHKVEAHLCDMWDKLAHQETRAWEMFNQAKKEAGDKTKSAAVAKAFDILDRITSKRLEILRMVDPGRDESVDAELVLIVVDTREELGEVMEAVDLLRVTREQISPTLRPSKPTSEKPADSDSETTAIQ